MHSTYASQLNTSSETFSRDQCATWSYYYEAIRVHVSIDGYYVFCSSSSIDTYGYVYQNTFDPFDLSSDLIASDNDGCDHQQFRLCVFLETNTTYILVVTTNEASVTGEFLVTVVRGAEASFTRIGRISEYDGRKARQERSTPSPSLDTSKVARSTYASALVLGSTDKYSRDQCQSSNYYYQALQMKTEISGIYRFQSNSDIRMFGYLYRNTFDPFDPSLNLLAENDRECGGHQLWLNSSLLAEVTYILVATTDIPGRTGSFTIRAFGAANITFSLLRE